MTKNPTVLFVPGAWHIPESYGLVAKSLQSSGYSTAYVNLPSVGPTTPLENYDQDVAAVRQILEPLVTSGKDVIVVAHSYGSMPLNEAVSGLAKKDREAAGQQGGVVHYVFCSAFITPVGVSLMDALQGNDLPWFVVNDEKTVVNPNDPRDIFYHDLDEAMAKEWVAKLKPFSYQTYFSKTVYPAYQHVPSTFIYCTEDKAIPFPVQTMMVQGSGTQMRTVTIDGAGHSPMLSRPEEVTEAIKGAVGDTS